MEALRYTEISVTDYHARLVAHSGTDKDHNFHGRGECLTPNTEELRSTRTHIARRIRRCGTLCLCRGCTSFLIGDGQGRNKTSVPRKCPLVLQVKVTWRSGRVLRGQESKVCWGTRNRALGLKWNLDGILSIWTELRQNIEGQNGHRKVDFVCQHSRRSSTKKTHRRISSQLVGCTNIRMYAKFQTAVRIQRHETWRKSRNVNLFVCWNKQMWVAGTKNCVQLQFWQYLSYYLIT
jgi:hypothetical protein